METGTLTGTYTLFEPATATATHGETLTEGLSDVVSSGTSSDSLYETSSSTPSNIVTDVLTTTLISSVNQSNSGNTGNIATTISSTLNDSSHESWGGPTTLTQTETMSYGSNAVITTGKSTTSLNEVNNDNYSLYETGVENYTSGKSSMQAGIQGLAEDQGYTGTESATVITAVTTGYSSTQAVTTTYGTNGTISGGSAADSLYETGNDHTSSTGTGTNVRHYVFSVQRRTIRPSPPLSPFPAP